MGWLAGASHGGEYRRLRWLGMSISPCHISRFSPEFQLACYCCRGAPGLGDEVAMRQLLARIDMPAFLDLAIARHRIGPLVHSVLARLPGPPLPPELMAPLAACARDNAVKALRATRTHILLARWFADAGIDWLPFKGITLARRYYGDIARRQVNDLDLWVPASKMSQARELLLAHGFRTLDPGHYQDLGQRGPRHRDYLARFYYEEQLESAEHGMLELHWQLVANRWQFDIPPEQLLARAETLELGGRSLKVMGDTELLMYLCEHGSRHGWFRLKWLADLPCLIAHREWNWPQVFERARGAGSLKTLLLGLALTRDLLGWVPPDAVVREFRSFRLLNLAVGTIPLALEAQRLGFAPKKHSELTHRSVSLLQQLLLSPSLAAARTNLWRFALSPNDLQLLQLPDRWFGLYYLLRPILFVIRQWRTRWAAANAAIPALPSPARAGHSDRQPPSPRG